MGYLASRVIPGEGSDFILEIPPLRIPLISNVIVKTLARIEWYLKEAVPLFILGTLILFVLHKTEVLTLLERAATPLIVHFLGLPAKVTEAFLIGFLRRDYGAAGLFVLAKRGPTQFPSNPGQPGNHHSFHPLHCPVFYDDQGERFKKGSMDVGGDHPRCFWSGWDGKFFIKHFWSVIWRTLPLTSALSVGSNFLPRR